MSALLQDIKEMHKNEHFAATPYKLFQRVELLLLIQDIAGSIFQLCKPEEFIGYRRVEQERVITDYIKWHQFLR